MKCSVKCKWFPIESYANTTWYKGKYGVKYADKKIRICNLTDEPITEYCECKYFNEIEEKLDKNSESMV